MRSYLLVLIVLLVAACSSEDGPAATPTPSGSATPTVNATAVPTSTAAPSPTATPVPPTATATETPLPPTVEPQPTATSLPPTPIPPTQPPPTQAPPSGPPPASVLNVRAINLAFNVSTLTVRSGATVTVNFENADTGVLHDISFGIPRQPHGHTCAGPCSDSYSFVAPAPRNYPFFCTVHAEMTGTLVVVP